jgi:hypothetical protein
VRELRQNVCLPFSLAPDFDPTARLSSIIDTAASANPFVQMKSVRVSCVSPSPIPFLGYCIARVTTCALRRKIVNKIVNTDTCHCSNFFSFLSLRCMQDRHPSPAIHGSFKTIIKDDSQWSNGRDITPWYVLSSWAALFYICFWLASER